MSLPHFPRRDRPVEGGVQPSAELAALADQAAALRDEVEAFVEGRLVEHLLDTGRPVPAWTVLNKVAHATVEDLACLAGSGDGVGADASERGTPVWLAGPRSLAAQLLEGATAPDEVAKTQRAVLIPLELWLIERSRSEAITSRRVIEMASEVLVDHRPDR